jgi:N utilization substance protein B
VTEFKIPWRRKARKLALQALYQWTLSGESLPVIEAQFNEHYSMTKVDVDFFHELLHQIPARCGELDALIVPLLDRPLADLNPVELVIMRMACYELAFRLDIPYKVVINEALELAKQFGATDGYKYVNAVIDKIAQTVRSSEME